MSMGKRRTESQGELWVSARSVAATPGHPFYRRLNALLDKHGFDPLLSNIEHLHSMQ